MVSERKPAARGAKLTLIVQLALAANAPAQLFPPLKSLGLLPPTATEVMCSAALPEFVTITVSEPLVVPWLIVGKESDPGTIVTAGLGGAGVAPMPLSCTTCGQPGALSAVISTACLNPVVRWRKRHENRASLARLQNCRSLAVVCFAELVRIRAANRYRSQAQRLISRAGERDRLRRTHSPDCNVPKGKRRRGQARLRANQILLPRNDTEDIKTIHSGRRDCRSRNRREVTRQRIGLESLHARPRGVALVHERPRRIQHQRRERTWKEFPLTNPVCGSIP